MRTSAPAPPRSRAPVAPPPPARRGRAVEVLAFLGFLGTLALAVLVHPAFLVVHLFCAIASAALAPARGRRAYVWFHAGLAFGVFALARLLRRPPRVAPPPGTVEAGVSFAGLFDFMVLCGLAQVVVEDRILPRGMETRPGVIVLFALFLLSSSALVWVNRSALFRYLTSVKTSVALVTYLAISSFAMTVILQQPDAEKAYLADEELMKADRDEQGRPMTAERREYRKFMEAQTALVYGLDHLLDGPPPATPAEAAHEERLRATFGPTQGHNIAESNAHQRETRRRQLERRRLADETGDDLWGFFQFVRATRLYEVRRAWWLVIGVLDLLAVCLVCVCVDRWRKRTKRYAFYFAHAGLVLVILGRHFTDDDRTLLRHVAGTSARGYVDAFEGQPTNRATAFEVRDPPWLLPFHVRLDRFEVDYYKEWIVSVADREFGSLVNGYIPREGKRVDLWDDSKRRWSVEALEHHLSVDLDRGVADDPSGPHPAAARVKLSLPKAPMVEPGLVTLVAGHPTLAGVHLHEMVDAYVRVVHAPDEASMAAARREAPRGGQAPFGRLHVRLPTGETAVLPVSTAGGTSRADVGGRGTLIFRAELLWKDPAAYDRVRTTGRSLPLWRQAERNPGVIGELFLELPGEEPIGLDRLYADARGFDTAGAEKSRLADWDLRLERTPSDERRYVVTVLLGPGGEAEVVHDDGSGLRAVPLIRGQDVDLGPSGLTIALEELHGRSRVETRVRPIPDYQQGAFRDDFDLGPLAGVRTEQIYVSATRLRVVPPEGEPHEAWITSADEWPHRFGPNGSFSIALREQVGTQRDYRSFVTMVEDGRETTPSTLIQVNDPLEYRGYKLYQMRYRPDQPNYSGLLVKRDRGLSWVYVGLPLAFVGIFWMLLVDPALARRRARLRAGVPR